MPDATCARCGRSFTALSTAPACPHCGAALETPDVAAPRARSSWRWPAALVLLLAVAAGAAALVVRDRMKEDYPSRWDPRVADLAAFVERERGLSFEHPVAVDFLSDADFRAQVTEHETPTKEDEARLESFEAVLRAVGLVTGDVDLLKLNEELVGDAVVGAYRFDDKRISVRGRTLDDERRSTLVHELTHALQDQHFHIADHDTQTSGEDAAFEAVSEADAEAVAQAWEQGLPEAAQEALARAQQDTAGEADFQGVPPVFVELLSFPYAFGPDLLQSVITATGRAGRDELFTRPPTSEENVVLPATYLAGQHVEMVDTPALRRGEKVVEGSEDDFGMVSLLVVLAERIEYPTAWAAVQGWSGDSSVAFTRAGVTCVRASVAFDEPAQAQRFEDAFGQWSQGFPATHSRAGRTVHLESCDPGPSGPSGRAAGHVSGIQGLGLRLEVVAGVRQAGASADRAACVADHVLESLGAERFQQLDEQANADPRSPAVAVLTRAGAQAGAACP